MRHQNGNAFLFILIAIALLGLLTVTMTRSGSNTDDTGNFEQNQIAANEILRYAKSIENAVQMLLSRGCSENVISFWHDSNGDGTEDGGDDYYNDDAPSNHSCHVFDAAGAGITYQEPNEKWLDNSFPAALLSAGTYGEYRFQGGFSFIDIETPRPELGMYLNFIKKDLCMQINRTLGVQNLASDTAEDTNSNPSVMFFDGTYGTPLADNIGDDTNEYLTGKHTFCWKNTSNNVYALAHILHAR